MSVDLILVLGLSTGIIGFAVWRGSKPEWAGAAIIALDIVIDFLARALGDQWEFDAFSSRRLVTDTVEFGLLFALALNANRVWPIFSAASQMAAVGGNLAAAGNPDGNEIAHWAVTQLPLFGELAALALGTAFHSRRQAAVGPYRDWRVASSLPR